MTTLKRQTALSHMFMHGQTILYGGRGLVPMSKPLRVMFTRRANRWIILRSPTGHADISFKVTELFWAAPAVADAEHLLHSMVVEYVNVTRRETVRDSLYTRGWADALVHAAMTIYGIAEEAATEWVGEMINDVETGRD